MRSIISYNMTYQYSLSIMKCLINLISKKVFHLGCSRVALNELNSALLTVSTSSLSITSCLSHSRSSSRSREQCNTNMPSSQIGKISIELVTLPDLTVNPAMHNQSPIRKYGKQK